MSFQSKLYLVLTLLCAGAAWWLLFPSVKLNRPQASAQSNHKPGCACTAGATQNLAQATPPAGAADLPPAAAPAATTAAATALAATSSTAPAAPRKRVWERGYLSSLGRPAAGEAIRFELVGGRFAAGTIRHVETRGGELILVSGEIASPEAGRFFFQKQTEPGKAGEFAGLIELPASGRAYRIEPTGPNDAPELVERRLDEVICLMMPRADAELSAAGDAEEIPPLDPQDVPDVVPPYNDGIISLQSRPGAAGVLYIDYRGGYTPTWGGITYAKPTASNAQIKDVWKRVCEDYMGFNINVTTDIRAYEAAAESSRQRCIVTPTTTAAPTAGGVAYLNSWNWTGDTPCWAFYATGKSAAEVISHEVGHTLTLSHDGRTTPAEGYFGGHGSGETGWAPIMGVGYYQPVAQWSKGEYQYANNTEDDLSRIVSNNNSVDYRADDTGATLATARYLEIASNTTVSAEGLIETTADTDAFRFTTSGGQVSLTAIPVGSWADLAIQATIADASNAVIATASPQSTLWARITTNLVAGTYTFRVTGAGRNDPLTSGFTSYASLGYYAVTGRVANPLLATTLTVAENSTNGTFVGTVPPSPATADPLTYTITSGNTSGAFSLDSAGALRVANSAALNYEALASNTVFTVQYQLFVTISNTVTPALTEVGRRVVVLVANVNERPAVTGFDATIFARTQPGTVVGTVSGSDPDNYAYLTYSLVAGNTGGAFAIASGSGDVSVAADINVATQALYTLTVRATDNGSPAQTNDAAVRVTVLPNATGLRPGALSGAYYDGIGSGTYVTNLTQHPRFPTDPTSESQLALLESDANRGDSYGASARGYLVPPTNGTYTFWIASDDASELLLGTTTNPASAARIAYVSGYTSPRAWTANASQRSTNVALVAGQAYYIEARLKEGGGEDHLAVAWKGPATGNRTNVISGAFLAPYPMNYVPHPSGFTNSIRRNLQAGAKVGRITVADVNAGDTHALAITAGNTASNLFSLGADGWIRVSNETALLTATSPVTLTIRATDSGSPSRSATSSARITLSSATAISVAEPPRELFNAIGSGGAVSDLTGNAKYPGRPDELDTLTNFNVVADIADSYGSRIRGTVTPPASGDYTFFIASDDASQLKFSRTTNAASATVIASVSNWVNPGVYTQYASQVSALQTNLVSGQAYYIEALHKEGSGGDHVSVAWAGPGLVGTNEIAGAYLAPIDINYAPVFTNHAFRVSYTNLAGYAVGRLAATDSPLDTLSFKLVSGNTNNTFSLNTDNGVLTLASTSLTAPMARSSFPLVVSVQDSGYGSLFPLKSTAATVTVQVVGPYAIGFTNTLRRNAIAGTKVGRVTSSDPGRGGVASYAITSGNGSGLFSVGSDGWVRASNEAALLTASSPVTLTVLATDTGVPPLSGTATNRITLASTNALPATPHRELFYTISGANVSDLTGNAKYPGRPDALTALTNFASPLNIGNTYGSRVRAYLVPPTNGHYRLFVSSDDSSQLKLSLSANPTGAAVVASVSGSVNPGVWTTKTSQASSPISNLVAGQSYYIEALHKENTGNDHIYAAWTVPNVAGTNLIGGANLLPLDINYNPQATNQALRVSYSNLAGAVVGRVSVTDSPLDTLTFKLAGGNTNGTFSLNSDNGVLTLANPALIASLTKTYFPLTVTIQDSGYGGLYPLHGTSVAVNVAVAFPPALSTWARQAGGMSMVWTSTQGLRYQLQSRTNLIFGVWQNVGAPLTGTGGPLTNSVVIGPDPSQFFRILLLD
jgi:hypothetical protein